MTALPKMVPHTAAKHLLLKRYLDRWFPILGKYNQRINYITVTGFGERRVVVEKTDDGYSVQIQFWDMDTKGHIIEDFDFLTELEALEKAHDLLGLEFERSRFGYVEER